MAKHIFTSFDPYHSKIIAKTPGINDEEMLEAVSKAQKAYKSWKQTALQDRLQKIGKLKEVLQEHTKEWAEVMSQEMGKPIAESIAEIEKCGLLCDYYIEHSESFLAEEHISTDADESYVRFDPLGLILGIMPWNFPFWQVMRFAVPAIIAGNTTLLKHASNVQLSAKNIEKAFDEAGFPEGVFANLPITSDQTTKLIEHKDIRGVSFTGSEQAGRSVAEVAGKNLKPVVLELGGSNALVVLDDCDVEKTAKICAKSRFQNNGQSCIAGKRLFVQKDIADEFLVALKNEVKHLTQGEPMQEEVQITALAKSEYADELEKQVFDTLGNPPATDFSWKKEDSKIAPNLAEVEDIQTKLMQEETFGPMLAYHIFDKDEEVPLLVNSNDFGLGASIFTQSISRAKALIPQLDEGAVFINSMVKSDPAMPFGGVKNSGIGRELGEYGLKSFVNIKSVWIEK
ncbi:MAG: aldehyde dehydrogenase family protein [Weeksellaceae bacterium]|nr:aldehyde dehydrogenase family protein [Weeksellaceae bacterium]